MNLDFHIFTKNKAKERKKHKLYELFFPQRCAWVCGYKEQERAQLWIKYLMTYINHTCILGWKLSYKNHLFIGIRILNYYKIHIPSHIPSTSCQIIDCQNGQSLSINFIVHVKVILAEWKPTVPKLNTCTRYKEVQSTVLYSQRPDI